jgi:ribosomal protein S8
MVASVINLLIKIKNFSVSLKTTLFVEKNRKYISILYTLYKNGLIQSFYSKNNGYTIVVRYYYNRPVFSYLKIFSKPSFSTYISLVDIYKLPIKKFVFFFSTSKGGLFNQTDCKKHKTGGKLLFMG